jgi:16S rRNA (cytidine1402-2'-O)-methyltransferase
MSESGCPGIADPGNPIVLFCHQNNIPVVPLIGPSAIFMTLMASGLNGQHFKFVGYLDKDIEKRKREIKNLEQESKKRNSSVLIMETPYRSEHVWKDLIMTCKEDTYICVGVDISGKDEYIKTAKVCQWVNMKWPNFKKKPAIFILQTS